MPKESLRATRHGRLKKVNISFNKNKNKELSMNYEKS